MGSSIAEALVDATEPDTIRREEIEARREKLIVLQEAREQDQRRLSEARGEMARLAGVVNDLIETLEQREEMARQVYTELIDLGREVPRAESLFDAVLLTPELLRSPQPEPGTPVLGPLPEYIPDSLQPPPRAPAVEQGPPQAPPAAELEAEPEAAQPPPAAPPASAAPPPPAAPPVSAAPPPPAAPRASAAPPPAAPPASAVPPPVAPPASAAPPPAAAPAPAAIEPPTASAEPAPLSRPCAFAQASTPAAEAQPGATVTRLHPEREAASNRREFTRRRLAVDVGMQGETNFWLGFSQDISEGGLFVATYDTLPVGTELELEFSLPGFGDKVHATSVVCWVREYREGQDLEKGILPGMGVRFVSLSDADRRHIARFVNAREPLFVPGFEDA